MLVVLMWVSRWWVLQSWVVASLAVPPAMGAQRLVLVLVLVQVPLSGSDGGRAQRQQPAALPGRR